MALVYVLWLVVLLTAIAFQMTYRGHLRARATAATGDATRAFFLARAGIESAINDIATNYRSAASQAAAREQAVRQYREIELGAGTYTLFAGMERSDRPRYGLADECARINVNTADVDLLDRLSVLDRGLGERIVALREELESFPDLDSLLLIDGIDRLKLYGEDQNGNGLLDTNENDGDESWPPDNGDGRLDTGLSEYLTAWSAARDVDADGETRINLNDDSEEAIAATLDDVSEQQAASIVYQRDKGALGSIFDLLDVPLVEKVKEGEGGDPKAEDQSPPGNPNPQPDPQAQSNAEQPATVDDAGNDTDNGQNNGQKKPGEESPSPEAPQVAADRDTKEDSGFTYKETGQKAFNEETLRAIADRVTVEEEVVLPGRINVNTAPLEVLACLPGFDESIALALVQERQNRVDGFTSLIDLLDVSGINLERLKAIHKLVVVRSDVFRARAFGVLDGSPVFASASAVLDRTEDTIKIVHWREHG